MAYDEKGSRLIQPILIEANRDSDGATIWFVRLSCGGVGYVDYPHSDTPLGAMAKMRDIELLRRR